MFNIQYDKGLVTDQRIYDAVKRGVILAQEQGYDVEGLFFHVKEASKELAYGAGATILEEGRSIAIAVDKDNPNFNFLSQLTVHEINHLEREKYSPIETLEEVLVSEGLAQMAEETAGFDLVSISAFQSNDDRKTAIASMTADFNHNVFDGNNNQGKGYDHYFGDKSDLPNHAGYALGLEMVKTFMGATGATIQEATQKPAAHIANYWKQTL